MASEGKTEENEIELDEVIVKEKAKLQEPQDYVIFKSLNKFEQKDIANIPRTEALNEIQAINIYEEIQDDCNQCSYPITPMEKLSEMKSCILTTHSESPKAMINISQALYSRITTFILSTNKVMMEMIEPWIETDMCVYGH